MWQDINRQAVIPMKIHLMNPENERKTIPMKDALNMHTSSVGNKESQSNIYNQESNQISQNTLHKLHQQQIEHSMHLGKTFLLLKR